ncbi:cyclic di-AMP binding protein CbpA [Aerococcus kribbianus]|uniref:Cyclic di-AMP binding protein CbpA n=1 Tax=Aerococcus kribbianus TaxID=2999064 RepID=A0A9X3JFP0_9LACT|nr:MULTISPECIES: cyclic di-AMP binding protein CbpA [unclassified Aerococcus]MCZ0717874.1 cyclic di-AMP binding protein CbpA [Aerococcus sp. YH-aer221]MCZ0726161.1 cyclic di-AMP binding protein CbpA [Aerococcus sp. YH-aer222]
MNITDYSIKKEDIVYVHEDSTLKEALALMETHHFRCIPILDKSATLFRGTIYRQHIYQYIIQKKSLDLPVTHLQKNATKYIYANSSFYQVMFAVRDLPYITILNPDHTFYGILTHRAFETALYRAWGLNADSYILTIELPQNKRGSLAKVTRIIGRYVSISSMISWADKDHKKNYMTMNLDESCDLETLHKIINRLEARDFRVLSTQHTKEIFL